MRFERLFRLITALVKLHEDHGPSHFDMAIRRALIAIAEIRIAEARKNTSPTRTKWNNVIRLAARTGPKRGPGQGRDLD